MAQLSISSQISRRPGFESSNMTICKPGSEQRLHLSEVFSNSGGVGFEMMLAYCNFTSYLIRQLQKFFCGNLSIFVLCPTVLF